MLIEIIVYLLVTAAILKTAYELYKQAGE